MKSQPPARKNYPSDITREQFALIREDLESFKKRTKPREVDLYDIFCGLLYVLKSGCQWRMIPSDLPDHNLIYYYYYSQWRERENGKPSLLERCLKKIRWRGPQKPWEEKGGDLLHR